MTDTHAEIEIRRSIEDRAIALGDERGRLDDQLSKNIDEILALMREWEEADQPIPFDRLASLVGVSRQTLYRWRDVAARLRAEAAEAD